MNSLKDAQELVASFGETPTLDLSSASDDLDLSAAVDAPSVTPGRLLGAFAYTVRQTPGVLASTLKSYRSFQAKRFPDVSSMDEPLDPFVADYNRMRGLDAGRTVFDEHFDRLPMEARIRASAKIEALTADGMPPAEAFKQATFDEIKESEKNLMNQLTAVEQATAMPKDYKESTGFLEDVARGMGTSVASMAGFMAGGPGLATAMAYAQMHGYKVQELEELGVTDPNQLLKGGMVSGALQAPLEAIGSWAMLSRIMKANGTWTSWLLKTAEGAAGEGLTEFVQQYPDVYASLLALNPDVSQGDIFSHIQSNLGDITTDALYAGAVGAVAGGATTGAGAGVHVGIDKLITTKQKAVNEERANRIDYLANKDELTPQDEESLREMLNLAEDADVKTILNQVKKQFELEKPIKSEKREAAKAFHETKYGTEQAEANVAIMDALARSAAEKGWVKNPAEFYDKLTFEAVEGEQVDEAATEAGLFQVDVWHGSPHRFDKMDISKVGTGEGAQAFGYGLYFTDKDSIARAYAKAGKNKYGISFKDVYKLNNETLDTKKIIEKYSVDKKLESQIDRAIFTLKISQNEDAALNYIKDAKKYNLKYPDKSTSKMLNEALDVLSDDIKNKRLVFLKSEEKTGENIYRAQLFPGKDPSEYTFLDWYDSIPDFGSMFWDSAKYEIYNSIDYFGYIGRLYNRNRSGELQRQGVTFKRWIEGILEIPAETTGEAFYKEISDALGSDREASIFLKRIGFDGIRYPTESLSGKGKTSDAFNYVVFDDKDVKLIARESGGTVDLFQGKEAPRGQITLKTNSIEALIKHFKAADASTTVHELGHFVTGMLWEQGDSDYLTLAEYAGVDSDAALAGLSGWTTEQHEKVAKAFETYLMEGRSPSQKLQQVFQRMKEWLIDIYRSIKALDVELTDEVRQVFDRLLTTEIERAENPLLEVREWFNVDEVTQRELARRADEAANMADLEYGDLVARAREMAITDKKKKKASAEKKLRAEMMKEATKSIEAEPFYEMIEELIKNGGMKQSVVEGLYDKALIFDIQSRRPGIVGKDGISPDIIGEQYGYYSIDEVVQDILQRPTKGEAIQTYFDGLWGEYQRFEHLSWAETYQEALEAELSIFEKITGKEGKPKPTKGIKKVIREATGIVKPEELKQLAEDLKRDAKVARDAWNAARKAMREETNEELSEAKRKAATKEKEKAIAKIQKLRLEHLDRMQDLRDNFKEKQRIDKYTKAINKVLRQKNLLPDYRSQIAAFVSEYIDVPNKFRGDSSDVDFITFLDQHQETNEYLVDAIRAEYSNKPQQRRNSKGYRIPLKADEFEVVYRTVKMLGHMASLEDQIIKGTEKIQRGQIISGMVNRMFDVWGAPDAPIEPLDALEKKKRLAWYQKLSQAGKDYLAEIRKPEFIFDALDGWEANGPNAELMRDIKHASDKELTIGGQYLKDLRAIFKKHIGKKSVQWARKLHEVPGIAIADPQTGKVSRLLSKEQMIMIALNSGNDGNLTALREGYALDDAQIQAVYNALTDKEKALVDDIWKLIDTLYPKLNEVHKVLTGVSLPKVEGRYFPLAFDRELSWKAGGFAQKQMEKDLFSSAYTRPNVAAGHRITRTGGKMPPELSFGVIAKHLVQTIHDITHQVPVRNIQKIIADPEYRMAVSHAMGEPIYKQLMPWLHNIARPMGEPNSRVEKVISRIRRNSTVVGLGLKFSVALLQPLAYTQTIDQVGMVQAVKALSQFYVNPRASMRFINESSPTMANRKEVYDRELMQIRDSFDKGALGGSQAATNAFFALIDVTDAAFRYPTWLAGYNVEMDRSGDHEKAVDYADKVVAKTQGLGMPKDMAMLQRGGQQRSEMVKLLTMFYTFFSVFTNRFMDTTSKYRIGKISLSQAVVSYWWILVLPALLEGVVRKRDLPEDPWEALTGVLGYLAAGFPLIRDVVNPILTGYRYSFTPAQRALELPGRISNAIKAKDKGDKGRRLAMEAMEVAGYVFGLPTGQAKVTMDGIIDLMDGQASNPSVLLFRQERPRGKTKPSM